MIKWLKDRQIGNAVNKKKIYENISIGPKFAYRGVINYGSQDDKTLTHLRWTSDGHYLVSLDDAWDEYHQTFPKHTITIWENPNSHTKHRVKSIIDLEKNGISFNAYFCAMQCHNSNVILGGCWEDGKGGILDLGGVIYLISLLTGEVNEIIRKAILETALTVFLFMVRFFSKFQYPYLKN